MSEPVITRFAPSPTGFLHIGGGRTALFNWLYAKRHGGKMLLRIEDTDRERSTEAAIAAILDGLKWLGITWDDDVIYQYSRAARHREVAHELLTQGRAYKCYASPEELEAMRERARAEGRPMRYDGRWRELRDGFAVTTCVLVGFAAGVLSGLFGVGGGIITAGKDAVLKAGGAVVDTAKDAVKGATDAAKGAVDSVNSHE